MCFSGENVMESLSQMLEDYRNGERGLPSYEELVVLVDKGVQDAAQEYEVSDNSETWNAIAAKVREEMAMGVALLTSATEPSC